MKKFYLFLASILLTGSMMKAQDTLLYEDFELVRFYDTLLIDCNATSTVPPGVTGDMNWYSWDSDGDPDASTGGGRPDGWFAVVPFSTVDQYITPYPGPDTNTVICANSWTAGLLQQQNWLMTQSVQLGTADTLFWKSAPFQTPRYCDGYEVRLSTTTNADNTGTFSNLLFTASEMVPPLGSDTTYATWTFTPASGFIHGADGNNIDIATTSAPILHRGQLRQFSAPLNAFANQAVYIAFLHNSTDDNLISLDDVMIRGTLPTIGVEENENSIALNLFPNPASENVQVNYTLTSQTDVTIAIYDVTGKLIESQSKGTLASGRHFSNINTANLAKGFYTVKVSTSFGQSTSKLIVK